METIRHVRSLQPFLVSSRNAVCGEERCVTTLKMLCCRLSCAVTGQEECFHPNYACFLRGCLLNTGATFAPERVQSGSLPWFYICLQDTATKCHARTSYPGASSPRLLYRGENFTRVRNLATVSCKRETRFGVKSVCR